MNTSQRIIRWAVLLALLMSLSIGSSICAQNTCFISKTLALGSPASVVAVDISNKGKPDLVCANLGYNTLTVLTNNGNGVFGYNATIGVGLGPQDIVTADVDGDGKPDLICVNTGISVPTPLIVLTNNGNGAFGSNETLNVGMDAQCVTAVDVNGDGAVDLVTANAQSYTLTVLTNNGGGIFGFNATLQVGQWPTFVVAADVNGDGELDLISANFNDNTLTVLTNSGSGVFGSNATLNVGSEPNCIVAVDVNGDGKPDLISANLGARTLSVLTNNGVGVFGSNATLNVGDYPEYVLAADIDGYGNGKLDLISVNEGGNSLTVLTNNGNGVFGLQTTLMVGSGPYCVAAADVDGDGMLDLVSANNLANSLTVLIQILIPTLAIAHSGHNLVFSWPTNTDGFTLQQKTNLSTGAWRSIAGSPTIINDQYQMIMSPTNSSAYYRLKR